MLTGILEPTHLIIILIVALVFLGPKRLPDAGRALGQGLSEFKRSLSGEHQGNPRGESRWRSRTEQSPQRVDACTIG
jgi:sec-independent protein translocase protein TatA